MFIPGQEPTTSIGVPSPPIHQDLRVVLPTSILMVLFLIVGSTLFVWSYRRKKLQKDGSGDMAESPSTTQIQNQENQRQQYSALSANTPSTQDTSTYKQESAG